MTNPDSPDARRALRLALLTAPAGAVMNSGGRDAVKQPDGRWVVEEDDEIGLPERTEDTDGLLDILCCYHGAHYPRGVQQ